MTLRFNRRPNTGYYATEFLLAQLFFVDGYTLFALLSRSVSTCQTFPITSICRALLASFVSATAWTHPNTPCIPVLSATCHHCVGAFSAVAATGIAPAPSLGRQQSQQQLVLEFLLYRSISHLCSCRISRAKVPALFIGLAITPLSISLPSSCCVVLSSLRPLNQTLSLVSLARRSTVCDLSIFLQQ